MQPAADRPTRLAPWVLAFVASCIYFLWHGVEWDELVALPAIWVLVLNTSLGAIGAGMILHKRGGAARKRANAYRPFLAAGGLAILLF